MDSLEEKISQLKKTLTDLENKLNVTEKEKELDTLLEIAAKSDFWQDIISATKHMEKISFLKKELESLADLKSRLEYLEELAKESRKEQTDVTEDLEKEIKIIEEEISKFQSQTFLSGKYDSGSAILSVHSGQGGTEAMDWAEMLLRMYFRYAEKKGWKTNLISQTAGEEAGIKSATIEIVGQYVYGFLKNEAGTHRLVRQSPFNADKLRQTSFALVEVLPLIEDVKEVNISPDDLEIDTFRSSGPGGQNVQKVETAVRIKHKPSGIVVSAQSERSQAQNKENAMKLLRAKIFALEEKKQKAQERALKGEHKQASWGNQIRSYVLHPYKLVKDLRTKVETNDAFAVLDGELEKFIEAEVKLPSDQ